MTAFIRSYTPAIRSNMARTWGSGRVPLAPLSGVPGRSVLPAGEGALAVIVPRSPAGLLELGQEGDEVVELVRVLLRQAGEGRHRRRGVAQRRRDRLRSEDRSDVGQGRAGPVVAVGADHVAGQ